MPPKVSVAIITANQEAFIADALEGAVTQDVDFDYEIIVADDCSDDRTGAIVADYQARYPDLIKAVHNETNLGAHENWIRTLARCEGTYIAVLDGDDYWTSPRKLQRQADLLDRDSDCALVFHPVAITKGDRHVRTWRPPGRKAVYDLADLLRSNFVATGSVMYRRMPVPYPAWYDPASAMPGDWILFCLIARHGSLRYVDEVMSVYRLHDGGIWGIATPRDRIRRLRSVIEMGRRLDADFDHDYTASVRWAAARARLGIGLTQIAPFLVDPLISLRNRFTDHRNG